MSDTSDQNSPVPKRKRSDSSTEQQNSVPDEPQSNQDDVVTIKTEYQQNSLEIIDIFDPIDPISPPPPLSPTTKPPELKIDDLSDELLVKIFEWLDFADLLHVANATKKLRGAAGQIYAPKYAHKSIKYHANPSSSAKIDERPTTFEVNDTRTCLFIFRAFGEYLAKLHLDLHAIGTHRTEAMSNALNEYCAKSLNELEMHHAPEHSIIAGKFPNLTILRVNGGILGGKLAQFKELFPMLHVLELSNIKTEHRKCIERTFPKLVHLKVHIETHEGMDFLKSNVKAAIDVNPQLRSLCIGTGCDALLLPYVKDKLPLLNHLEIQQPRNKLFDGAGEPVRFERVRNVTLDIAASKDSFTNIPFHFDRLEKFVLNAPKQHRDKWVDFVERHSKLVELHLLNFDWFHVMTNKQLEKIFKLPKLTRLVLDWHINDTAAFVQLMQNCSSLQEIRLATRTRDERAAICSKLNTGWYMHIDRNILILQRTKPTNDDKNDSGIGLQSN